MKWILLFSWFLFNQFICDENIPGKYPLAVELSNSVLLILTALKGAYYYKETLQLINTNYTSDENSFVFQLKEYLIFYKTNQHTLYSLKFENNNFTYIDSFDLSFNIESKPCFYSIIDETSFILFWLDKEKSYIQKMQIELSGLFTNINRTHFFCNNCQSIDCDYCQKSNNIICVYSENSKIFFTFYDLSLISNNENRRGETFIGTNPQIKYLKDDYLCFCFVYPLQNNKHDFQCQYVLSENTLKYSQVKLSWQSSRNLKNNLQLFIGKKQTLFILFLNNDNKYEFSQYSHDLIQLGKEDINNNIISEQSQTNAIFSIDENINGYAYENNNDTYYYNLTYPECLKDLATYVQLNNYKKITFELADNKPPDTIMFYQHPTYFTIQYNEKLIDINFAYNYKVNKNRNFRVIPFEETKEESILFYAIFEGHGTSLCKYSISICYNTCQECEHNNTGNINDHQCLICEDNYFFDDLKKKCLTNNETSLDYPLLNGYYLDEKDSKTPYYKACYLSCQTCNKEGENQNHHCTKCRIDYYELHKNDFNNKNKEKSPDFNCIKNEISEKAGYYFDSKKLGFYPCYKDCKSCEIEGDIKFNNCTECIQNKISFELDKSQCLDKCNEEQKWYIDDNRQKHCDQCPKEYHLYVNNTNQCVQNCSFIFDKNCVYCSQHQLYTLDNKFCVLECNEETDIIFSNLTCKTKDPNSSTDREIQQKKMNIIQENKKVNELNSTELFINYSKIVKVAEEKANTQLDLITFFQGLSFSLTLFRLSDSEINSKIYQEKEVSSIDFSSILSALPNIQARSKLEPNQVFVMQWDIERETELTNQVDYQLWKDPETLLLFDNINNIIISSKITNEEDIGFKNAYLMHQKGINVFNESDPFFNDICFNDENDKSRDLSIQDRRSLYFPNTSFCDSNCILFKIDYDNKMIHCNCSYNNFEPGKTRLNPPLNNNFNDSYHETYEVIKCPNQVFNSNNLLANVGFWLFFLFLLIIIISIFCFLSNGFSYVNSYTMLVKNKKAKVLEARTPREDEFEAIT